MSLAKIDWHTKTKHPEAGVEVLLRIKGFFYIGRYNERNGWEIKVGILWLMITANEFCWAYLDERTKSQDYEL